ncbi:uncharacterized protein LOC125776439 isoform X2 [Bactrocera dorsalis]|uniref:Uncharacterized protein LOC125776439 isoform X2 n=1 Tax=Bactrocera dorsalis TaxID=27457 RepID=A0ABM3J4Y2_BACDO|nr:uncharacterized protein LOC125776439 isoform X2 [Bactrocera dorsalis]
MENRDKFALVKIKCELQMHETANQRCKEPNNQADCLRKVEWNVNHVFQPSNKFCGVHAQRRRNNGSYVSGSNTKNAGYQVSAAEITTTVQQMRPVGVKGRTLTCHSGSAQQCK